MVDLADVAQRNREGIAALFDAATTPTAERRAFLAAAAATTGCRLAGAERAARVLEPAVLPLLAVTAWRRGNPVAAFGLLAGAVGQAEKNRRPSRPSALGVAAVAANHAAYIWPMRRLSPDAFGVGLRAVVWASGMGWAASQSAKLLPAVATAGAAVATTSTLAGRAPRDTRAAGGLSHGANLLLASEALTCLRERGRVVAGAEQALHCVGHLLVLDGLLARA